MKFSNIKFPFSTWYHTNHKNNKNKFNFHYFKFNVAYRDSDMYFKDLEEIIYYLNCIIKI